MQHDVDIRVREGETKEQYRSRMASEMRRFERERRAAFAKGETPVVMDVDDFGFLMPGHDDLLALKRAYPDFKITAFTIPLPKEFFAPENRKHFKVEKYREWARLVNELEWIEVAIHGFTHVHEEFECSYEKAILTLTAIENFFDEVGLRYAKIFKAPYWQYSYDALVALRDRGYVVAIDRNHQRPVPEGLKTYVYNWSFEEPLPRVQDEKILKGHGHFTGKNTNNIGPCLPNIYHQLPESTHFITIGEYIKQYAN